MQNVIPPQSGFYTQSADTEPTNNKLLKTLTAPKVYLKLIVNLTSSFMKLSFVLGVLIFSSYLFMPSFLGPVKSEIKKGQSVSAILISVTLKLVLNEIYQCVCVHLRSYLLIVCGEVEANERIISHDLSAIIIFS